MLVIRFSRVGRHNHAQYRIIVQEKTQAPTKKHLEIVGSYDPHSKKTVLQEEKIKEYLANGAQPSDSVYNLLVRNEVITGAKRAVKLPEKKEVESSDDVAEEKEAASEEKTPVDEKTDEKKENIDKTDEKEVVKEEQIEEKETEAPAEKKEVKEESADTSADAEGYGETGKSSDEKKEEKVEKKESADTKKEKK